MQARHPSSPGGTSRGRSPSPSARTLAPGCRPGSAEAPARWRSARASSRARRRAPRARAAEERSSGRRSITLPPSARRGSPSTSGHRQRTSWQRSQNSALFAWQPQAGPGEAHRDGLARPRSRRLRAVLPHHGVAPAIEQLHVARRASSPRARRTGSRWLREPGRLRPPACRARRYQTGEREQRPGTTRGPTTILPRHTSAAPPPRGLPVGLPRRSRRPLLLPFITSALATSSCTPATFTPGAQ